MIDLKNGSEEGEELGGMILSGRPVLSLQKRPFLHATTTHHRNSQLLLTQFW